MKTKLVTIGKILLSTIGVMAIFTAIIGTGNYLQSHSFKYIGNILMIFFPIAVYGYVYLLNKKINGLALSDYGFTFRKFFKNTVVGFFWATAIIALSTLGVIFLLGCTIEFAPLKENFAKPLVSLVSILVIVGIWEEFFFRGFVFNTLVKAKFGFHWSALISALLFSVIHWSSFDMDETSWLWYVGIIFLGYLLVVMYTLTKSIWSAVSFHFFWNLYSSLMDGNENEIGVFSISNYAVYSKNIDDITVITIGLVLGGLLIIKNKTLKKLYPTKTMFTFPGN